MTNGKNPNLPGTVMRTMADNIAKHALAIAEGTEEKIASIQAEAEKSLGQLKVALDQYQKTSRDDAAKLAEAVTDQFGVLAQRIDDLTAHCNNAAQAFAEHHKNIVNGLAAIKEPAAPKGIPTAPPVKSGAEHLDELTTEISRAIPRVPPRNDRQ